MLQKNTHRFVSHKSIEIHIIQSLQTTHYRNKIKTKEIRDFNTYSIGAVENTITVTDEFCLTEFAFALDVHLFAVNGPLMKANGPQTLG